MKKLAKNIPSPYKFEGTPIFRDTTALPFLNGGPLVDKTNHGKLLNSIYASALGDYYANGGMLKRADGSYSPRGLWDNIRDNAGSGKKPSKQMLTQEKKINREYKEGGQFPTPYSLPEDSFMQGGNNLHNSVYASSPGQYPAPYNFGGTLHNNLATRQQMYMPLDHITRTGGSILSMSNTPQLEGEGKDLAYKNGGHMYPDGGQFYTYSGRPGATYQKVNNQWYIQTEKTDGQFIPVQDPTGRRAALLNAKATPIAMTTNKYQRTYNPLVDSKPQVAENTVPKNSFDAGMQKSVQNKLNQGAIENQAVRAETINQIKNSTTLTEEQKNEILLDPRKVEEYKYLGENVVYGDPNQGTIKEFNPDNRPSRAWEIATNPFTAFEYAVSGGGVENMPHNINEMRMAGIDPGVVQSRNLVGNALNSNLNLLDAGDKFTRNAQEGNYLAALGEGMRFIPAGAGAGAAGKEIINQAERIGVKNVLTGKASFNDLLVRNDLYNIKTVEGLQNYKKALEEGKISATNNRFYSTESNPDFLNYSKGQEQVFVHRVPQTKAAAAGKSLGKVKPKGDALVARQRSLPHSADIEELIASGELAGYSDRTLQSLREVAANPEGYWNLDTYKNNPELQKLVADPHLVNHNEHFLKRPAVKDFQLTNVEDITKNAPALIDAAKIGNDALKGYENLNPLGIVGSTAVPNPVEEIEKYKLGGTMNFKSNADYHKWLAYGHATGAFEKTPGNQPVSVGGKSHNVQHELGGNMYASGGFANAGFMALPKEVQAKIRANTFADGGPMEAQLTEFSEGGRHEENLLGGIPQGTAPDGKLNLVEQGETKLNSSNYIFSDSLKVDKGTAEEFALPKNEVGKTFAEISKKLNRPNSRRENDTIEQVAIKRDLDNLMNAQEQFKQKEVQKKMDEIRALDPNALAGMQQGAQQQMPQMEQMQQMQEAPEMPQNVPQSVQPMGMPEGQPMDPNQIPPEMMAQMPEAQQGQPVMAMGGGMYKCGGKMYNFGGSMYDFGGFMQENNDAFTQAGTGALKSAGKGAMIGANPLLMAATGGLSAPIGAVLGGVFGGIKGGVEGHKQDEAEYKAKIDAANRERLTGIQTEIPQEASNNSAMALGQAALQGGQDMMGVFMPTSQKRDGGFAHNAGPMGQPLTNLYALGGPTNPDNAPEGTPFNLKDRNSWMGDYSLSIPEGHDLNLPIESLPAYKDLFSSGLVKSDYKNVGDYITAAENWERTQTGQDLKPAPYNFAENNTTTTPNNTPAPQTQTRTVGQTYAHEWGTKGQNYYAPHTVAQNASGNTEYIQTGAPYTIPPDSEKKELGGYLDSTTEDDMINHLTNLQQSETTHSFLDGGGFNLERDRLGNIVPYKANYEALGNTASLDNPYNKGTLETKMALPVNKVDYSTMTEEELAQYLSDLDAANETLKDKNQDLTMNQSLAQGVGQLLPAAYNVGQGLFGKVGTLNPQNFYQKADFQPWEYNINPQLKEVQRSYAQLSKAAQNSGLGGGSYMSNMQQGAMSRNEAMSKLYAEKQNVDAANALDAKVRNKAIEAANKGVLANVTDYNIKAKEAKRQMLAAGLKQGADAARSSAEMDAQTAYMKLIAPDFASTFKYNTIFDQASEKVKAAAKKKKEQEG